MESRSYPKCCTTMYCGKIECPKDCRNLPALEDFKRWREETNATQPDPIWCPGYYESSNE